MKRTVGLFFVAFGIAIAGRLLGMTEPEMAVGLAIGCCSFVIMTERTP